MDIGTDGDHNYCFSCGRKWSAKDMHPWWPIAFDLKFFFRKRPWGWSDNFFSVHYWQVGWADVGVKVFQRIIRLGRLIIKTGPNKVEFDRVYIPELNRWFEKKHAVDVIASIERDKAVEAIMDEYGKKLE